MNPGFEVNDERLIYQTMFTIFAAPHLWEPGLRVRCHETYSADLVLALCLLFAAFSVLGHTNCQTPTRSFSAPGAAEHLAAILASPCKAPGLAVVHLS